ncbi:hypothetical protein WJX81_001541 [Elliptochloris bilobata]|uniref:alpha-1,2-Mannosidase n=1 Tax=Elliptochloris bilobata TaxID=381761 RepID=A0AAW1SIT8_9CHLO
MAKLVEEIRASKGGSKPGPLSWTGPVVRCYLVHSLPAAAFRMATSPSGHQRTSRGGSATGDMLTLASGAAAKELPDQEGFSSEHWPLRGGTANDENGRHRLLIKAAARHSWAGYLRFAYGHDELAPLSRNHSDTFCGVGATMIDSLDTLWLLGMRREFARARTWVATELDFNRNCNVSVFEMVIRGVGGLLAAHDLSGDVLFLERAEELTERLMPAFATPTGLPNSTINLATGESAAMAWANGGAVLSELGSVQLELVRLSQATGRPSFGAAVERIIRFLDTAFHGQGLLASVIRIETGEAWNEVKSMGAGSDSYYEYLLKLWLLGGKREPLYRDMWVRAMDDMAEQLVFRSGDLRFLGRRSGENLTTVMEHLACFVPGNLALGVESGAVAGAKADEYLALAAELTVACFQMYAQQPSGLAPEVSAVSPVGRLQALPDVSFNILRPEAVESLYMMWRVTGEPRFREMGWRIFQAFNASCRVDTGGFAAVSNVTQLPPQRFDKMESFWLSETLKYLYLLFTPPSVLPADAFVLNTEAHPLRVAGTAPVVGTAPVSGTAPAAAPAMLQAVAGAAAEAAWALEGGLGVM